MKKNVCLLAIVLFGLVSFANPTSNREEVIKKIIQLTEEKICNPDFLKTKEWEEFVSKIQSRKFINFENEKFVKEFNKASEKLTFSHFYLRLNRGKNESKSKSKPFEIKEVDPSTAVLQVRQFVKDASGMYMATQEIIQKDYKNLIIDLRDNGGGTLDAAVVLGRFLTNDMIDVGTFVTRSWFVKERRYPIKEDIQQFPFLKSMTLEGFREISNELAFRVMLPPHKQTIFNGKVFILINSNTASACEPLVHALKKKKIGQIIGERTAGQMLSAEWFEVDEDYSIFIPTVDYLTAEGTRLDMLGVLPDVKTSSDNALNEVLKHIQ